jgi:signal transduction histidine kinase
MVVASGALAIVVGGTFGAVLASVTNLRGTTELRRETREQLVGVDLLEKRIIDLETWLRGYVITRDDSFLDPSKEARAALPASERDLLRLSAGDRVQRARVERLVHATDDYVRLYAVPLLEAVRRGDPSARSVERTIAAKRRVDALRAGMLSFRDAARSRLATRDADVDHAARLATIAAIVGVAGSVLLILAFSGYLTRVIVQPLRRAAHMADRLAGGDLTARMGGTDIAEIGTLHRSFNFMAGSLEGQREELASVLAEQQALRRLATLVAQGAAPSEIFAVTAAEIRGLVAADAAVLWRYGPQDTATVIAIESEADLGIALETVIRIDPRSSMGAVYRTGALGRQHDLPEGAGPIADAARKGRLRSSIGVPIRVDGRLWGVVVASSRRGDIPDETADRMLAFTELVATAIANADSRGQLIASRGRLLSAADDARRRVARDLHDGAQQRLVHTIVTLKLAQRAMRNGEWHDGESPDALVDEALEQAETANAELRDLSHGILPTVLIRDGLRAGIDALVARAGIPVTASVTEARLPPAVEASAYFIVAEALTNVAKHAGATRASIEARIDETTFYLEIRDDGAGGARLDGTGLVGLQDRITVLGGHLRLKSPPGGGTEIAVTLPL